VNLLEFNHQHVIALLKLLQNVDPIQLMLQLHVETLQLNNVNKDVQLVLHQLDQDQLELHLHHINLLHLNLHNLLHVIVMDKLLDNVDHHQLMDQLHVEQELTLLAKQDVHQKLHLLHTNLHQFNHQPVIVLQQLLHNVDHHQQMDQLHVEHEFT
jgi:hypothetical protein